MALLWCDGFDHYGTDKTNMTDGAWANVSSALSIASDNARTGAYSLKFAGLINVTAEARRVFGGAFTTVGCAYAFYTDALPTTNDRLTLFSFRDTANVQQVTVILQSTGIIEVKRGTTGGGTSLGATTTPAITAEAYTHIECMVTISDSVGEVEVRINGVTVLSITGADTAATSNIETSQVVFMHDRQGSQSDLSVDGSTYIDDIFAYDDSGSYNNTFIGDRRVITLFPNADTAQEDWTPSTGTDSFEMINEADPNDDTDYLTAGPNVSPGLISEFDMENLPAGVASISAVVVVNRMRKTDAGVANVQAGIISGASEQLGTDHPLTEAYKYYHDVVEADPDTAAPFTPSAIDAAQLKIERTA